MEAKISDFGTLTLRHEKWWILLHTHFQRWEVTAQWIKYTIFLDEVENTHKNWHYYPKLCIFGQYLDKFWKNKQWIHLKFLKSSKFSTYSEFVSDFLMSKPLSFISTGCLKKMRRSFCLIYLDTKNSRRLGHISFERWDP